MGIFDFVKDVGKSIEESMDMVKEVVAIGIAIEEPEASLNDGVVNIKGKVKSQEDREKIILALGNLAGVQQVEDNLEVVSEEDEAQPGSKFYTVQAGDSLSKIAKVHYGDPMKYTKIFEANKPMLESPEKIYPGQVLRLPEL